MTYLLWLCSLNNVPLPRATGITTFLLLDALFERYWDNLKYINKVQNQSYYC